MLNNPFVKFVVYWSIFTILLAYFQIQAANGEVTITNDGATILKQMNVTHPAAKMVSKAFLPVCNLLILCS